MQKSHQVPQLDDSPIRKPLGFRPADEFIKQSGVGPLRVLRLPALVAEVLEEIFDQGAHRFWGSTG